MHCYEWSSPQNWCYSAPILEMKWKVEAYKEYVMILSTFKSLNLQII